MSDGPGQVKLPVGQENLSKAFFFIPYEQIVKVHKFVSQASKKNMGYVECCWINIGNADGQFLGRQGINRHDYDKHLIATD